MSEQTITTVKAKVHTEPSTADSVAHYDHWLKRNDIQALGLLIAFMIVGLIFIPDPSAWITLTLAGLAMGMMIFVMTSGFTLVFGLMDILNFGHGAFISIGAFVGFSVIALFPNAYDSTSLVSALMVLIIAMLAAGVVVGVTSYIFERVIIKRVYGNHLMQILITTGGMIVAEQMIHVFWGAEDRAMLKPLTLQGGIEIGDFVFEKYRILAVVMGAILFVTLYWIFKKTRIGLLIRAGVENKEMVQSMGFNIEVLFIAVFIAGSVLAGMGGVMWGLYDEYITAHLGQNLMITIFIVAIIGGLGSIEGCFLAALKVGLLTNYVGFLFPKLALVSTLVLMVAILLWRPKGLVPVSKGD